MLKSIKSLFMTKEEKYLLKLKKDAYELLINNTAFINKEKYKEEVLKLKGTTSIDSIELDKITRIILNEKNANYDINVLNLFPSLNYISIFGENIFSNLKEIENINIPLKSVIINDKNIILEDLNLFSNFKLEFLKLENVSLLSMNGIESQQNLKSIEFYKLQNEIDISKFNSLNKLVTLEINATKLKNIDKLKKLRALNHLTMRNSNIQNIDFVNNFPTLTSVDFENNIIDEIPELDLPNLKILELSGNKLIKIKGINKLEKLITFKINNNLISKLENMDKNINLSVFHASNNEIYKIKNISHLKKLRELYLDDNNIEMIEGLPENSPNQPFSLTNTSLEEICIRNNPLKYSIYNNVTSELLFEYSSTYDKSLYYDDMYDLYYKDFLMEQEAQKIEELKKEKEKQIQEAADKKQLMMEKQEKLEPFQKNVISEYEFNL